MSFTFIAFSFTILSDTVNIMNNVSRAVGYENLGGHPRAWIRGHQERVYAPEIVGIEREGEGKHAW